MVLTTILYCQFQQDLLEHWTLCPAETEDKIDLPTVVNIKLPKPHEGLSLRA